MAPLLKISGILSAGDSLKNTTRCMANHAALEEIRAKKEAEAQAAKKAAAEKAAQAKKEAELKAKEAAGKEE